MDNNRTPEPEADLHETLRQLLGALKRRRWWILLTAGVTMLATAAVSLRLPNRYVSEAKILVAEQQIPQSVIDATGNTNIIDKLQIITQEILSRARLVSIADQFGLYAKHRSELTDEQIADLMRKSIEVQPVDPSAGRNAFNAFSISFTGDTPALAQGVTKTLASLFIESDLKSQQNQATNTLDLLKDQVQRKRMQLAELEQRRQVVETQYLEVAPEQQVATESSRLPELRVQLQNTMGSLNRARQQRLYLESVLNSTLTGNLARLQSERSTLLLRFTAQYPSVVKKDQEIARVESMLKAQKSGGEDQPDMAADDPALGQLWGQLRANSQEILDLSKDEDRLKASLTEEEGRVKATATASQNRVAEAPLRRQQMAAIDRENEILTQEIVDLEKKQQQSGLVADVQQREQGQQFREIDPASFPSVPSSPKRVRINLTGLGAGIALGLALAFFVDTRTRCFYTETQLGKAFPMALTIGVPMLLTPREKSSLKRKLAFEWLAGLVLTAAGLMAEYYVYRQG